MNNTSFRTTFSLLHADYVQLNKSWNYRDVMSPFCRIYLIDGGRGSLGDTDQSLLLEEGHLYLIPSFTKCEHVCKDFLSQYYVHVLEEHPAGLSLFTHNRRVIKIKSKAEDQILFKQLLSLNPGRDLRRSEDPRQYQNKSLKDFQQLNNEISLAAYIESNALIMQLLARFLATDELLLLQSDRLPIKIESALYYIEKHIGDMITVKSLAEYVSQSPHHFSKTFLEATGQRPLEYLMQKRIEKAQFLMVTTPLSIAEIAVKVGFESISYFSRSFKKVTGQNASHYYKANRF